MLYTFKDVSFDNRQILPFALKRIHGIGLARADYICALAGLAITNRMGYLNSYRFFIITFLIKQYYGTDVLLKRMRENRLKDLLSCRSYKSIRFSAGLPIRGQHTHNNAKTVKNFRFRSNKL